MENSDLRAAFQKRPLAARGWRCPDETMLAACADGTLPGDARPRIEGHLAECAHCRDQVATLLKLEPLGAPAVPGPLLARAIGLAKVKPARPRWVLGLAAVAAAGLVFTIVPREIRAPSSTGTPLAREAPAVRQGNVGKAGPVIEFPQEGASVTPGDLEFRWSAQEGALFYSIRLLTAEGNVVLERQVDTTHWKLEPAPALAPGQKYYVWVSAYLSQDKALKSSPVGFVVAQP